MSASLPLMHTDEKPDRKERGTGGGHDKKKNKQAAQILLLRQLAYFAQWRRQNCEPIKCENHQSECIPTGNCCTREPKISVRNKEYHDASGQSQNEAMACIWAADKIDNSHLWSRVTNIRQRWQATFEGSPRDCGNDFVFHKDERCARRQ